MQRNFLFLVAVALVGIGAFLISTSKTSPNTALSQATNEPIPAVETSFSEITNGSHSAIETPVNYIVTSSDNLTKLWDLLKTNNPLPTVDFKTESVAAVFAGTQSTAGYFISVTKIVDEKERTITITVHKPGKNCIAAQTVTTPYQVIKVKKSELTYRHINAVVEDDCK